MSREQLKTRVMEEIDRRLPEFKDHLRDVVRIPTDNPPGDTTACVTFLAQYLKERGLPADVYEPRPTFQSLVSYKKGRRDGRNLVLRAPGPVSGWRPEGVVLRSLLRRVPGRQDPGSRRRDMKAGTVASLLCLVLIQSWIFPSTASSRRRWWQTRSQAARGGPSGCWRMCR